MSSLLGFLLQSQELAKEQVRFLYLGRGPAHPSLASAQPVLEPGEVPTPR